MWVLYVTSETNTMKDERKYVWRHSATTNNYKIQTLSDSLTSLEVSFRIKYVPVDGIGKKLAILRKKSNFFYHIIISDKVFLLLEMYWCSLTIMRLPRKETNLNKAQKFHWVDFISHLYTPSITSVLCSLLVLLRACLKSNRTKNKTDILILWSQANP